MENIFTQALSKIVGVFNEEKIDYMIVGGFAVSYHNRGRTTNDIDIVIQIHPHHVKNILKHFPDWKDFEDSFKTSVERGMLFNITDFDTGIRYDFIAYKDSDYNWRAFERRVKVNFLDQECFIASIEDLVISKLQWYNISESQRQLEDIKFLLLDENINMDYIKIWINKLNLKTNGILE